MMWLGIILMGIGVQILWTARRLRHRNDWLRHRDEAVSRAQLMAVSRRAHEAPRSVP